MSRFSLIVTDTSPLITLALGAALDTLLLPQLPIAVPDAVYIEATRVRGALGAEQIALWIRSHLDRVQIVPTSIGIDQQRRLEEGRSIRGLGEHAAIEVLESLLASDRDKEALLLFEDSDLTKRTAFVDPRVSLIGTGSYLRELEAAGLIQSTDYILDLAAEQGRRVERQRKDAARTAAEIRLGEQLCDVRDNNR